MKGERSGRGIPLALSTLYLGVPVPEGLYTKYFCAAGNHFKQNRPPGPVYRELEYTISIFFLPFLGSGTSPIGFAAKNCAFCTIRWVRSSIFVLRRLDVVFSKIGPHNIGFFVFLAFLGGFWVPGHK